MSINEAGTLTRQSYTPTSINEAAPPPPVLNKLTPASGVVNTMPGATFILNVSGMLLKAGDIIVFDGADVATDYINATLLRSMFTPCSATARTVNVNIRRGAVASNVITFQIK